MNLSLKSLWVGAMMGAFVWIALAADPLVPAARAQAPPPAEAAGAAPPAPEDQTFIFSPRGRRDPFEAPFSRAGAAKLGSEVGTRDTIARAAKILDELGQAAKAKNVEHFKTIYENLTKLLDTKFTSEDLKIWAVEMARSARQLKDEMGSYEQNMATETALQNAEKRVLDLQAQIQQGKFDQVRETYQVIVHDLTGMSISSDPLKQRRDDLLQRAGRLVSQADAAIARDLLTRGETILTGMKEKLQKDQFEDVIKEFDNLKNRLGALSLADAQLKSSRDKLLLEAAEVSHQAEIGAVMREMKKADALLAKMKVALDGADFSAVASGYQSIQEILKPLKATDPALIERKAEMLDRAAAMDRSAKIRTEFLGREVKITGIAWNPTAPAAIINGRSYGEGDAMDDVTRVEKIGKADVIFKYKGESVAKGMMQ